MLDLWIEPRFTPFVQKCDVCGRVMAKETVYVVSAYFNDQWVPIGYACLTHSRDEIQKWYEDNRT